jgi:hypothetical protein
MTGAAQVADADAVCRVNGRFRQRQWAAPDPEQPDDVCKLGGLLIDREAAVQKICASGRVSADSDMRLAPNPVRRRLEADVP